MIGVYPTYALQAGTFLAGALFCFFNAFFVVFIIENVLFVCFHCIVWDICVRAAGRRLPPPRPHRLGHNFPPAAHTSELPICCVRPTGLGQPPPHVPQGGGGGCAQPMQVGGDGGLPARTHTCSKLHEYGVAFCTLDSDKV